MVVSLQHSDHDGVVRIFVGHPEVVKRLLIIGASLSEPHIDEFAVNFPYIRGATALLVAAVKR